MTTRLRAWECHGRAPAAHEHDGMRKLPRKADDGSEADLEGATVFAGRLVWISSNGRTAKGNVKPERFQLFASHRQENGQWVQAFPPVFHGLPQAVGAMDDPAYAPLRTSIGDLGQKDEELASKRNGFNVEGLITTQDGEALLVGLLNPQPDHEAALIQLENAQDLLDDPAKVAVPSSLTTLDLGKRGIQDIAWSPDHQIYLIAAGQADDDDHPDTGPGFALFSWEGPGSHARSKKFAASSLPI